MLSTQLRPAAEAQSFRDGVLAGFDRPVSFVPLDGGPFNDRLAAEAEAGKGSVAVVTAQQADFSGLAADKLIEDMTDRLQQLGDVPFNEDLLDLAKLEGILAFIPWVQGTYLMAAHKAALDHLPSGWSPPSSPTSSSPPGPGPSTRPPGAAPGSRWSSRSAPSCWSPPPPAASR
jgi:multiple sugar transport system substrate-binding protein